MLRFSLEKPSQTKLKEEVAKKVRSTALSIERVATVLPAEKSSEGVIVAQMVQPAELPSRTKRPIDLISLCSLLVVSGPFVFSALRCAADSVVHDYFCARARLILNDPQGAVVYLSSAIQKRPDSILLQDRAHTYRALNELARERDDLLKAIKLNVNDSSAYTRAAVLEVRLGNLPGAIHLYKQLATWRPWFSCKPVYARVAVYRLLLLGETKESAHLLATIEEGSAKQLLTALIYRAEGDRRQAFCACRQADTGKDVALFMDSRPGRQLARCLQALLYLDEKDISRARRLLDELTPALSSHACKPVVDVLNGWLLLEEGRLDECLTLTQSALEVEGLNDCLIGLNIQAALHRIRQNVFLQKKLASQATREERLYKETNCTGLLFTPVRFQ